MKNAPGRTWLSEDEAIATAVVVELLRLRAPSESVRDEAPRWRFSRRWFTDDRR